jgi:hypothetical protein
VTTRTASRRTGPGIVRAVTRARAPLTLADEPPWGRTAITLKHQLKACGVALTCTDLLERLGCPRLAADHLRPAVLHFEALVYRADLALEDQQQHAAAAPDLDAAHRQGLETVLAAYGLSEDRAIAAELDAMDAYPRLETGILRGSEPLDDDVVHATCYARSSHIRLLLRFALSLAELPVGEEFLSLARHVFARDEVVADCVTYTEDLAEQSFNTLRLHVRLHGPGRAADAQRALYTRILGDLDDALAAAPRAALLAFAGAFLPRPTPVRSRRYAAGGRTPLVRRAAPLPALRRHCRRQATRSRRLVPVPVPAARSEPVRAGG